MAIELKHATQATVPDAGTGEIGTAEWNEAHNIVGGAGKLFGFDGSGNPQEVDKPTGSIVGDTDSQTLTNKTLQSFKYASASVTGTTPAITASSGTVLTWTLSGNSTPTDGLANNEFVLLLIDDGAAYTVDFTSLVDEWESDEGTAPVLKTTGYTPIVLYKVSGVVYGARVGNA